MSRRDSDSEKVPAALYDRLTDTPTYAARMYKVQLAPSAQPRPSPASTVELTDFAIVLLALAGSFYSLQGYGGGMDMQEMGASLSDAFAAIPGFRHASGQRKSRPAILTLAVCAMFSGARSAYAIHKWGCCLGPGTVRAVGFTHAKTPAVSCLHRVFSGLGVAAFGAAVVRWSQQHPWAVDRQAVAVDGKALRGIHGEELPGVRLVAGYARPALNRAGL